MRKINQIIIHCSDSRDVSADTIKEWHLERGFSDIGYHYIIRIDGQIELGRPIVKPGAHAKGYNSYSLGVCLTGLNIPTQEQEKTLVKLIDNLTNAFDVSYSNVLGHNEVNKNKLCPTFNVRDFMKEHFDERQKRN